MHKKGQGAKYTRIHEPEKLVYVKQFESRSEAMRRERKIKTLSHNKKQQLINKNNNSCAPNRTNKEETKKIV